MLTLCGLYVAQGIPFGFVTVTFAAWLARPQHGLTTEQLGPILAMATLPWSFKFVWGPLMDRYTIRSMGRRRPWIIFAQLSAVLVLGSMMLFDNLPSMVWTEAPGAHPVLEFIYHLVPGPLAALILLANIFVSMQDVAVDALAVDLLEEEERGLANGLMYGSSYLGTAVGGFGLGWVVANYGIQAGLFGQAMLLLLIMLLPVFVRERRERATVDSTESPSVRAESKAGDPVALPENASDRSDPEPVGVADRDSERERRPTISDLFRAFSVRATLIGVFVALAVKVGIGVLTAVLVNYLLKDGGWTQEEYTGITGGWAVMLGLSGAALGGVIADRTGPKPVIFFVSVLLGVLWVTAGLFPAVLTSWRLTAGLLIAQEFLFATLSVALFSMFMSISWPRVAATQFTAYMALMNFSTTIGSYAAGKLSSMLSVPQILIVAGILQALLVLPALLIDLHETRRTLGDN